MTPGESGVATNNTQKGIEMKNTRNFLAALALALVLTTPAVGGIIHSDAPAPAPSPTPATASTQPTDGSAVNGIIHSDVTDEGTTTGTLTDAAVALAQLLMSLF